jgi:hypothetical protein
MAMGSTQPLTEMSTKNLPSGNGRPARKADNLTAICKPRRLRIRWASTACSRDISTFYRVGNEVYFTDGNKMQVVNRRRSKDHCVATF